MGNDMKVGADFPSLILQNLDKTYLLGSFNEAFNISDKD
jgi:hypothetical protein